MLSFQARSRQSLAHHAGKSLQYAAQSSPVRNRERGKCRFDREPSMQSVRAMREEVGTASAPDGAGWSRIVFIAVVCALGGVGFLAATILMNGRALSFFQRPVAVAAIEQPAPPVAEAPAPAPAKPKPQINDRFQAVDVVPRGEINKATLARCRSHLEAGRPFESLSLKRIAEMRDGRRTGDYDPEAICRDYLTVETKQAPGR
jgi:hypothetical protein